MRKKFIFKHKIGKVYKDKRGFIKTILNYGFSACLEVTSKKALLGKSLSYKKDEHFIYIMDGKILFFYRDRKRGAKLNYKIMKKGELFFTTYKQDHLAYFLENTYFFAFSSKKRFKFDYEKI